MNKKSFTIYLLLNYVWSIKKSENFQNKWIDFDPNYDRSTRDSWSRKSFTHSINSLEGLGVTNESSGWDN